ncbi:MAG: endolytic transglycosylase MltG [Chloroflexota bacterium]|nr:endolytic transglycosylase MltG [Chloroflexota bacterium]
MSIQNRRELILSRRSQLLRQESSWRAQVRPTNLLVNAIRLAFLLLVGGVLLGVWLVGNAHLTEQFLGAPQTAAGLIDPNAGKGALTPDNIEKQVLAFSLRLRARELSLSATENARPRPFTINPGEPARFIAARLQEEGFIRDADLFNLYLRVSGLDRRVEQGSFMLAETMTVPQLAEALQQPMIEQALITIPEGFRAEEIAERLASANVIEADRFLAAVRQPSTLSIFSEYDFLQTLPAGASLEGFLFPDTYFFPVLASTPEQVIGPLLDNFAAKVGAEGLSGSNLSGHQLINLASIVEREAVQADERPLIASVYLNRLNNSCVDVGGQYLQADPTVQYARGVAGNWWWKPESLAEYQSVISPYNTYLYPGLPPNPIASPGLSAIEATRRPAQTNYCFFVATGDDGRHVFAQTLAEHQQNLQTYGYQ